MKPPPRRTEDRIFEDSYLASLPEDPIEELRRKKAEGEQLEAELSFARRLLQGKIDILRHELEHRAAGGVAGIDELIKQLPAILSDGEPGNGGRLPRMILPERMDEQRREVERLASESSLARMDTMSVAEIRALTESLTAAESGLSARRRSAHEVVDRVSAELVRRFRDGTEDPTALLGRGRIPN